MCHAIQTCQNLRLGTYYSQRFVPVAVLVYLRFVIPVCNVLENNIILDLHTRLFYFIFSLYFNPYLYQSYIAL